MSDLKITFVKRAHEVQVDLDAITWGDALRFQKAQGMTEDQANDLMNDLVQRCTGQDPLTMPATIVSQVIEAIMGAISGGQGKSADSELGNSNGG